jgi:YYY domain-containing protein
VLKSPILARWWRPLALGVTAVLGLAVRLYGLDWDQMLPRYAWLAHLYGPGAAQGTNFHPDERQILYQVVKLSRPTGWAQFLDQAHSPLNPHFFAYGTFPLYLLASIGNLLSHLWPTLADFAHLTLTGRVVNALFDTATVLLTAWLALLLMSTRQARGAANSSSAGQVSAGRSWSVALLAAACVAFTPFEVQQAHFSTVDTILLFFVMLTLLACVKLIHTDRPIRWSLVAGLGFGLGLATKTSAAPLLLPLLVALGLRLYHRRDIWEFAIPLVYTVCITLLAFIVAMPYALLDFSEFSQQVAYQGDLARGMIDLPYVRQFAGTLPVVYELQNLVVWGLGLMLGLVSLAGLAWICWRLWRREMASWLVLLSWVLVYGGINCTFFTKYMRYLLPVYPSLVLMGACFLISLASLNTTGWPVVRALALKIASAVLIGLVLLGTLFQCLALDNVYSQPNTRIQASIWLYQHLKPGTPLTYEQWDDALPVPMAGYDPSLFPQAAYAGTQGQSTVGLDLYGSDTLDKAQMIAALLMQVGAITMPTDRLDMSIPRLPARYPLTIHYYQLLFGGQLGFHLAAQFEVRPSFLGITLDDSGADESYTVFDHPTARIFVRDTPFPFQTPAQLVALLLQGVQLPPPNAQQTGVQQSLLLSPQQIADEQSSPPFGQQFPASSPANHWPLLFWWLALALLGLLAYPLTFLTLRGLTDRGYMCARVLGLLLLAYLCWLLASWRLAAFSHYCALLVVALLASVALLLMLWLRRTLWAFLRERWRLLLLEECLFTLASLLFVLLRSLDPDLWHPFLGGEKPMELAFLNGILRSPSLPPLDPWFAGGSINYYYYGYVLVATLIKLTGIAPTTAFNLALPTLFALTFTGSFALVYSLTRRLPVAFLGGYLVALLGNFDGAQQVLQQFALFVRHLPVPAFSYWQSSRVIPFTINEFPFWSFLFADLHPHVIAMPLTVLLLSLLASFFLERGAVQEVYQRAQSSVSPVLWRKLQAAGAGQFSGIRLLFYLLTAFVFGTIASVNPWDAPVCALVLGGTLLIDVFYARRAETGLQRWIAVGKRICVYALLSGFSYLFFWPFYASYQQLYVNGIGLVKQATQMTDYLRVSGFWLFLVTGFLLFELYRWWGQVAGAHPLTFSASLWRKSPGQRVCLYLSVCVCVLSSAALLGTRVLLALLLALGLLLFYLHGVRSPRSRDEQTWGALARYTYLLLLVGLLLSLGIELVYVRDFLDGGDNARLNTFFKFSMQIWLYFALGGALVIAYLWNNLRGLIKRVWVLFLLLLLAGGSVFLVNGTYARIQDHQNWIAYQQPQQDAHYTPTLDGFAFLHAWYPGDARAITWLNDHISGAPVILEAATPYDFSWGGRVSVYTGLPDVLGWLGHENEQRYQDQPLNRLTDVGIIYSTPDTSLALELLHHYQVRYIYIGALERLAYAPQSNVGLAKFARMAQEGRLLLVYRQDDVTIYQVL